MIAQNQPKEENKKKTEVVTIPANTIDFKTQLSSNNLSLDQLGVIIENGRRYSDVGSLLSAAMILFLEEKNTNKKAQITAIDLLKEASELAKTQKSIIAVKNCADVWNNSQMGNNSSEGKNLLDLSKSFEEELAANRGPGAKVVDCKIENFTEYDIYVYIDGVYKGKVPSGYYIVYQNIGAGYTTFYAETDNVWTGSKYTYYYWKNSYNLKRYDYTSATDFTWSIY
jgi:hypothetical protein